MPSYITINPYLKGFYEKAGDSKERIQDNESWTNMHEQILVLKKMKIKLVSLACILIFSFSSENESTKTKEDQEKYPDLLWQYTYHITYISDFYPTYCDYDSTVFIGRDSSIIKIKVETGEKSLENKGDGQF